MTQERVREEGCAAEEGVTKRGSCLCRVFPLERHCADHTRITRGRAGSVDGTRTRLGSFHAETSRERVNDPRTHSTFKGECLSHVYGPWVMRGEELELRVCGCVRGVCVFRCVTGVDVGDGHFWTRLFSGVKVLLLRTEARAWVCACSSVPPRLLIRGALNIVSEAQTVLPPEALKTRVCVEEFVFLRSISSKDQNI
ncbi:hypothetical protein WMY93_015596 [Mugilogobius chulae]|uniref:Uncharacterized protein n=1 Tax=Mugilogobius chulae TaxID=88201 RepID=A0AAW0NV72_9GOBI